MAYIGNEPSQASQRIVTSSTATASQTVFNASSGYSLGYIDVYQNGTKLVNGDDYTAADGTSITLTTGALVGDSVELVAFIPRGLTDGYLKSEADAKYLTIASPSYTGTLTGGTGVVNLGSGQFYKDASGNVGIGTSSPSFKLDVANSTNTVVKIKTTSAGSYGALQIFNSTTNSEASIGFRDDSDSDATSWVIGKSVGVADAFGFYNGSTRMLIDSSGNVGIGTSSPTAKLDVSGTGRITGQLTLGSDALLTNSAYVYSNAGGSGVRAGWFLDGTNQVVSGFIAGTERMRIDSSGNLLVGTTVASAKLSVGGSLYSTTSGTAQNNPVLSGRNLNTLLIAGSYVGTSWTNAPSTYDGGAWALVEVFTNGSDQWWQRWTNAPYLGMTMYIRGSSTGTTWNAWQLV